MDRPRTVLVTGAAKRIGSVISRRLYQAGYGVAIHYGRSEKEARATAEECGSAPLFQADLEKVDDIKRMFQAVDERFGGLYGLVNNAARFRRVDPWKLTESDWDFIHSVNLKATFFCCQQGALLMRKAGAGRIVNISSLGGIRPWDMYAHYCASKAGVIMLTRALAKAFAPQITVNSVAPGVILASSEDPRAQDLIAATPAQRSGTPDEIADAVLYFINASNFVTGQVLAVDGGLSQR
jgi:NAD(P)-dependent dehydrogenase (short-subunit alcohol dehydrogenase family)